MRLLLAFVLLTLPLAAQVRGGATRPKIERPEGPVWQVIRKNCTECHGIDDYAFYALDQTGWGKLIAEKHKPGDTNLAEADATCCWDGWERSRPQHWFPRTCVPEITAFFSDRKPSA
jgi:hypothetical protein